MYIEPVPNRNSSPAIVPRESYRENGKVRERTLCDLSIGGRSMSRAMRQRPLGMAQKIGLDTILGSAGHRCRDLVLAMIAARIIEPEQWPLWLGETGGDPETLLRPAAEDVPRFWPIDKKARNVRNGGPELIEPIVPAEAPLL